MDVQNASASVKRLDAKAPIFTEQKYALLVTNL